MLLKRKAWRTHVTQRVCMNRVQISRKIYRTTGPVIQNSYMYMYLTKTKFTGLVPKLMKNIDTQNEKTYGM